MKLVLFLNINWLEITFKKKPGNSIYCKLGIECTIYELGNWIGKERDKYLNLNILPKYIFPNMYWFEKYWEFANFLSYYINII